MPGPLSHVNATLKCPHGGTGGTVSTNIRVKVGGMPVALVSDTTNVAGCPFQVPIGTGTKPQPCVKVQWSMPAARVKVMGKPVLLQTSTGLCQSAEQIPQGPATVVAQTRVRGM